MITVAVAGGLGDMGRLIVEELVQRKKYDIYVLSRKGRKIMYSKVSLYYKQTTPLKKSLTSLLSTNNVHTVICAMCIDFQSAADSQVALINAADKAPSVKRFIPSEFNVDYELDDDVLPYPEKVFHVQGRRALEKSSLEYTYIYNGMFMDYYGMPNVDTNVRPLYNVVDPTNGVAAIPGDGNSVVVMTYTKDVARYVSLALEIENWPSVMKIVGSRCTLNDMVRMIEKNLGRRLSIIYDDLEKLLQHESTILPSNEPYIGHFPGGRSQVMSLLADLGAGMALGAYREDNLGQGNDVLDVVQHFAGQTKSPTRLEELLEKAWKGK